MREEDPLVARLMDIAMALEGLYRHASTHAAGLVIGDRPLEELVPLYRDPRSDIPVTQFSMKYVEGMTLAQRLSTDEGYLGPKPIRADMGARV